MTKIGFTSGCFDLIHPGHIYFLNECKKQCDYLIVALASQNNARRKREPIFNEMQRYYILNNLKSVDLVVVEDDKLEPENLERLLKIYEPDKYFTNSESPNLENYRPLLKELNIEYVVMERYMKGIFDVSTSKIINKIRK